MVLKGQKICFQKKKKIGKWYYDIENWDIIID